MYYVFPIESNGSESAHMITAAQMRAARALLGIDQQTLADLAGVSLPTIQRMEASEGNVRGIVDTLTKVVAESTPSVGHGRGVRFKVGAGTKTGTPPRAATRKKGSLVRVK